MNPQGKLALLYVVDGVLCRVLKLQDAATLKTFKSVVSRQLPALFGLAAPDGINSVQKVKKVVMTWKQKHIFDDMTINVAQAQAGPVAKRLLQEAGVVGGQRGSYAAAQQAASTVAATEAKRGAAAAAASAAAAAVHDSSTTAKSSPQHQRVVAKFDLASSEASRLALHTGRVYEIVSQIDANWIQGRCTITKEEGMFPCTYVEAYAELEPPAKKQRIDANLEPYVAVTSTMLQKRSSGLAAHGAGAMAGAGAGAGAGTVGAADVVRRVGEYTPTMPTQPTPPGSPTPYGHRRLPASAAADDEEASGGGSSRSGKNGGDRTSPSSTDSLFSYQDLTTQVIKLHKPKPKQGVTVVHIFDLDETLIQFDKLQAPRHAERNGGFATADEVGTSLQQGLEDLIFKVADTHFFFDVLDGCNQHHAAALKSKDDGRDLAEYSFTDDRFAWREGPAPAGADPVWTKLAYRFRAMADRYNKTRLAVMDAREVTASKAKATHRAKYALLEPPSNVAGALTFAVGALVEVTKHDPAGWSSVVIDGVSGVAPSNYLEPLLPTQKKPSKDPSAAEVFTVRDAQMLTDTQAASLLALHADLEVYTDGWLEAAIRLLDSLSSVEGSELVLVTNSELSAAFAKLVLFRLSRFFPAANVYSSAKCGKEKIFAEIKTKYSNSSGRNRCEWFVYGDGPEEAAASGSLGWPFKELANHAQLHRLLRIAERRGGNMKFSGF